MMKGVTCMLVECIEHNDVRQETTGQGLVKDTHCDRKAGSSGQDGAVVRPPRLGRLFLTTSFPLLAARLAFLCTASCQTYHILQIAHIDALSNYWKCVL